MHCQIKYKQLEICAILDYHTIPSLHEQGWPEVASTINISWMAMRSLAPQKWRCRHKHTFRSICNPALCPLFHSWQIWIFPVQREMPINWLKPKVNRKEVRRNEKEDCISFGRSSPCAKRSAPVLNVPSPPKIWNPEERWEASTSGQTQNVWTSVS